jgi:hypothetical protein
MVSIDRDAANAKFGQKVAIRAKTSAAKPGKKKKTQSPLKNELRERTKKTILLQMTTK